ncbi:hypothetical protein HZH66_005636 [Vespula vulgaris]|uniref:Uncharacterized protein n=1 Tax=Vespula vulgaris TaxID=7454 RepID=A0A834K6S3_VESVU|nr:hypothetical protein HZH66_005636 [Vespula vulgaris]
MEGVVGNRGGWLEKLALLFARGGDPVSRDKEKIEMFIGCGVAIKSVNEEEEEKEEEEEEEVEKEMVEPRAEEEEVVEDSRDSGGRWRRGWLMGGWRLEVGGKVEGGDWDS